MGFTSIYLLQNFHSLPLFATQGKELNTMHPKLDVNLVLSIFLYKLSDGFSQKFE